MLGILGLEEQRTGRASYNSQPQKATQIWCFPPLSQLSNGRQAREANSTPISKESPSVYIQCTQYHWSQGVLPPMSSQGKHCSPTRDRINELGDRRIEFTQYKQHREK